MCLLRASYEGLLAHSKMGLYGYLCLSVCPSVCPSVCLAACRVILLFTGTLQMLAVFPFHSPYWSVEVYQEFFAELLQNFQLVQVSEMCFGFKIIGVLQ
jgi:hypothetical protein